MTDFKCSGIFAMLAPAMLLLNPPAAQARDVAGVNDITGLWMTDDGQGAVQIEPCGEKRCGRIVWLKTPLDKAGRPMRDANNPSPEARQKPLCGAVVIKDAAKQTDGTWDGGSIYDPEEGKAYSVMLRPADKDRLEVRGYLGIRSFGETMIWTRGAEEQLKRCQPDAAKAKDAGKAKDAAKAK